MYNTYANVEDAKMACNVDAECQGVFDHSCDDGETSGVYLCRTGATYGKSGDSCIYEKNKNDGIKL